MSMCSYPNSGIALLIKPELILEIFKETLKGNISNELFEKYFDKDLSYYLSLAGGKDNLNLNNEDVLVVCNVALDALQEQNFGFIYNEDCTEYFVYYSYDKTKDVFDFWDEKNERSPLIIQIPYKVTLLSPAFSSKEVLIEAIHKEFEIIPKSVDILDFIVYFDSVTYG